MGKRWIVLLSCLLTFFTFFGCSKREKVVARIGSKIVISLEQFREDFTKGKSKDSIDSADLETLKDHLNKMIDDKIILLTAYEEDFDQDSVVKERVTKFQKGRMLQKLYEKVIIEQVIKEQDIRDYYAHSGKEVITRKIEIHIPRDATPDEKENIRSKMSEILKRIDRGEDFASLAKECSDDKKTSFNGGLMNALSWKGDQDPILNTAFTLGEGEVSDIIEIESTFLILKIDEIRHKKRDPYEKARKPILDHLLSLKRPQLNETAKSFLENLKIKNRMEFNEETVGLLAENIKKVNTRARDILVDSLQEKYSEALMDTLVYYSGDQMTIADFIERFKKAFEPTLRGPNPSDEKVLKDIIENWLVYDWLYNLAFQKGLHRDREVSAASKSLREKEMTTLIVNKEIVGEIQLTEQEVYDYYNRHLEENYMTKEQVKVQEVRVNDRALAEKIARQVQSREDFGKLAEKYTNRPGFKKKKGILNYFSKGRYGKMGEEAFRLEVGEITGPIDEGGDQYGIIKLLDRKSPQPKSFEKIKLRVERDLKQDIKDEREEVWLNQRRQNYTIYIFDHVLANEFKKS